VFDELHQEVAPLSGWPSVAAELEVDISATGLAAGEAAIFAGGTLDVIESGDSADAGVDGMNWLLPSGAAVAWVTDGQNETEGSSIMIIDYISLGGVLEIQA